MGGGLLARLLFFVRRAPVRPCSHPRTKLQSVGLVEDWIIDGYAVRIYECECGVLVAG